MVQSQHRSRVLNSHHNNAPTDDDIDFLRMTHDNSENEDEQVSGGKNRDENLERG